MFLGSMNVNPYEAPQTELTSAARHASIRIGINCAIILLIEMSLWGLSYLVHRDFRQAVLMLNYTVLTAGLLWGCIRGTASFVLIQLLLFGAILLFTTFVTLSVL